MKKPQSFSLLRIWSSLFANDRVDRDQLFVLRAYSVIALVALTIFGALHIARGDALLGQIELVFAAVIALNVLAFNVTRNMAVARTYFLISITAVLLVLLVTGGTEDTGIFWLFVFPNLAFFLAGKRQGVWWVGILGFAIAAIWGLAEFSVIDVPYASVVIRQALISLAVVIFGVYIYQSARERALQRAHDSQRDLQEYLDHMTTFSVKVSLSGSVLLANKAAKEASGLGERLIGTSFLESPWWAFDQNVQRRVEAAFYQVLTGQPVNYDEKLKAVSVRGSSVLSINFSMIPIFNKRGKLQYILAEARDISSEQAVDRAKSEFIGLASHQLREPVFSTMRLAERVLADDARRLSDTQRTHIRELYRTSQHMTALIDDMLLVSQLELSDLPIKPQRMNLAEFCQQSIDEFKNSLLQGKSLQFLEDYPKKLPEIPMDPEALKIILHNLISNAIKYTPNNGHIYIRVRQIDEKLHPRSHGSIQIEVQDSGVGIPKADQKKIFTKFFRAQNNESKTTEGTGLGLYVVKTLVEYVGGTIAFQSEEGVGTIFIVTLPLEGMTAQSPTPK